MIGGCGHINLSYTGVLDLITLLFAVSLYINKDVCRV